MSLFPLFPARWSTFGRRSVKAISAFRKAPATLILFFILASAAGAATHPLIGTWRFRSKIGPRWYSDVVTITSVSTKTGRVQGHIPICPNKCKVEGYVRGTTCILEGSMCSGPYVNVWVFSFAGTKFGKHLGVRPGAAVLEAEWHPMTARKYPGG